jgi:hypothetical protein
MKQHGRDPWKYSVEKVEKLEESREIEKYLKTINLIARNNFEMALDSDPVDYQDEWGDSNLGMVLDAFEQNAADTAEEQGLDPGDAVVAFDMLRRERFGDDEEELEETSAMGAGGVEGAMGAFGPPNEKDVWKIREAIRSVAFELIKENSKAYMIQENKLRKVISKEIKNILTEKIATTGGTPHKLTGINQLATDLKVVIPMFLNGMETLTTSPEQRQAYVTQILHNKQNLYKQAQMNFHAGTDQDGDGDLDEQAEPVESSYHIVDEQNPFIDINPPKTKDPVKKTSGKEDKFSEPDLVQDIDPTGRNKGNQVWKGGMAQVSLDGLANLSDPIDREAYIKYDLINTQLYADQKEDEMSAKLSQIDTDLEPGDIVDDEDGLGGSEMSPSQEEDPFAQDDEIMEEWKEALSTKLEFITR